MHNEGAPLYQYNKEADTSLNGVISSFDIEEHRVVREKVEEASDEIFFERSKDFPGDGNYYICYKPIIINGETRAVPSIAFKWSEFRSSVLSELTKVFIIIIDGLIIMLVLLHYFLCRKAIQPIRRIQSVVREYTDDKDSSTLTCHLWQCTAGFGA